MIEEDEPPPNSKGLLKVLGVLGIVSIGVGAYHGFAEAQGISLDKEDVRFWLQYGPAVIQGSLGVCVGSLLGFICGIEEVAQKLDNNVKNFEAKCVGGGILGAGMTGMVIGTGTASIGLLETLVGYGLGYAVGYVIK